MANRYKKIRDEFDRLETKIKLALEIEINQSKHISKHLNQKCLKVNVFDYTELVYLNGELTFLDKDGLHYNIDCDCTLTDLLDILNTL